jgi:hypothetical protein
VVIARAQSRAGENFTIIHVDPEAFSQPLPVLSSAGTIRPGDIYELVAVELSNDVVPHTPVLWRIHYTSIAALSPRLNAIGPMSQYWPD